LYPIASVTRGLKSPLSGGKRRASAFADAKQDGTLVDTFVIDKAKDTTSDSRQSPAAMPVPVGAGREAERIASAIN